MTKKKSVVERLTKLAAEVDDRDSPSADGSSRFAVDQLIRRYGYRIHARPRVGEPSWIKQNAVVGQADVLDSLDPTDVADANYEEDLYGEGF